MSEYPPESLAWQKSSWSVGDGACIEIVESDAFIFIRDSRRPDGPLLSVSHDEWRAFVKSIKTELYWR